MKKIISIALVGVLFAGCAFTSSQVAEQYNKTQQLQYSEYAKAKAEAVKEVMQALTKVDRGGMKIELDESGRIKAINYTERLDMSVLKQAMAMPTPKAYVPKSTLAEMGDFFFKLGSFATPISSMWFGYKTAKSNNQAQVAITQSNNQRDTGMYNAFTSNFQNSTSVSNTNTTNIEKTNTSTTEKQSNSVEKVTDKTSVSSNNVNKENTTTTTTTETIADTNGTQ